MKPAYEKKVVRMLVARYADPGPQRSTRPIGTVLAIAVAFGLGFGIVTSLLERDVLTPFQGLLCAAALTYALCFGSMRWSARLNAPAIAPYVDVDRARARLAELEATPDATPR